MADIMKQIPASRDIMTVAEIYLKRVYGIAPHPFLPVDEALEIFKTFKNSPVERERKIFSCVMEIVFEQHLFIKGYPENKLVTIGNLFGGFIEYDLFSYTGLSGDALRVILNALKAAPGRKMYTFGIIALDRFKCRLKNLHQYCADISKTAHFKRFPQHLIEYIEYGKNSKEPTLSLRVTDSDVASSTVAPQDPIMSPHSLISQTIISATTTTNLPCYELINNNVTSSSTPKIEKISIYNYTSLRASIELAEMIIEPDVNIVYRITYIFDPNNYEAKYNKRSQPMPFFRDTDLTELLENDDTLSKPTVDVQKKIAFILKHLNPENFQTKGQEIRRMISEKCLPWLSRYIITKSVCFKNNLHSLYLNVLDYFNSQYLNSLVLSDTYKSIKALLEKCKKMASESDRSTLNNLGHWLGMITIAKNRPIALNGLDIKSLLEDAQKIGQQKLQFIVPFIAKILNSCTISALFKPSNPWTMTLLNCLHDIYQKKDLDIGIKAEIIGLFKQLNIELKDVKPKNVLNYTNIAMQFNQRVSSNKGPKRRQSTTVN